MRIAIFHDYLENAGGGEKLVLGLAEHLNATIITTSVDKEILRKLGAGNAMVISLGKPPKIFLIRDLWVCTGFFFADYSKEFDYFIFSGNRSVFASWKHKPNTWICYSPERAAYDLHEFYENIFPPGKRFLFSISNFFFKIFYNMIAVKNIQQIVSISETTQKRVKKYLSRESTIALPGIDTKKYYPGKYGDYWLSVNRLYPSKRIELQIEAFRQLPKEKLVIVGGSLQGDFSALYRKKIENNLPENVRMLGVVGDNELRELYAECKAFITTPVQEDYGLTALEAMASGKAVVAVNEGGFKETVLHGKTGFLVKADVKEILKAVKEVSGNPSRFEKASIARAEEFDVRKFIGKISRIIENQTNGKNADA